MKATHHFATLALVLLMAFPALAIDATQTARAGITPKSPVPTGSVATWPMDAAVPPGWLACNGQTVPTSYPELRALMSNVPNYNNRQFLRGATSGAGSSVADSTRSHTHVVPSHSHTVSGTASAHSVSVGSQSVTGTAAGQTYLDTYSAKAVLSPPIVSVQTWADDLSDTEWQVNLRLMTADPRNPAPVWVYPTADLAQMMVMTLCRSNEGVTP